MPQHEEKICPRCQKNFECKVGNITECQCFGIQVSEALQAFLLNKGYEDCLCADCLRELTISLP